MSFDGEAFGLQVVGIVKAHLERATASLEARIAELTSRVNELDARAMVPGQDGSDGRDGSDGNDGADGKDGAPGADGLPGKDGEPGEQGEPGAAGRDGVGLAGALIDRAGELVVTLSNGETRALGPVVGRDGADGAPGQDGAPGRDGADGFGFDDMTVDHDGGRNIVLRWSRGDLVKEARITLPIVLDTGVFKAGASYVPGDGVTFAGSYWIAQEETNEAPGTGKAWRLAVKKGRDGKEVVKIERDPKQPVKVGADG